MGAPIGSGGGIANGYNPNAQQGSYSQAAQAYTQQLMSIHARQHAPAKWRVDGQDMTFEEFVDAVFPEDTPQKTFFLLKFSK